MGMDNKIDWSVIKLIMSKLQRLGNDTFKLIEEVLTVKERQLSRTPAKHAKQSKSRSKSPLRQRQQAGQTPLSKSPGKAAHTPYYHPMERDCTLMERRVRAISSEQQGHSKFKVQNKHSYFLNEKHPKVPLYLRAEEIVRQKEMKLSEKRQEKMRQKEEEDILEEEFLASLLPSKTMTKQQAHQLSEKLYKEHYNRMGRQNEKQIRRVKEEFQKYRNKPEINDTSKEIFRLYTQKNELGSNVFDRFEQYSDEKKRRTKEGEKKYQQEHYPFHPTISSTSRMIMNVKDSRNQLSKNKHGVSCSEIRVKRDMSSTLLQTNQKNSYSRSNFDSPVLISHFG